jgi:hypothetical protein
VFIVLPAIYLINSHKINTALIIKKSNQTSAASASASTKTLVRPETKKNGTTEVMPSKA